jgi:hypothetical protein
MFQNLQILQFNGRTGQCHPWRNDMIALAVLFVNAFRIKGIKRLNKFSQNIELRTITCI